jgi:hypothetical protein
LFVPASRADEVMELLEELSNWGDGAVFR